MNIAQEFVCSFTSSLCTLFKAQSRTQMVMKITVTVAHRFPFHQRTKELVVGKIWLQKNTWPHFDATSSVEYRVSNIFQNNITRLYHRILIKTQCTIYKLSNEQSVPLIMRSRARCFIMRFGSCERSRESTIISFIPCLVWFLVTFGDKVTKI